MSNMFHDAHEFIQNISGWNINDKTNIHNIFCNCPIKEKYKPKKIRKRNNEQVYT